MRAVYERGEKPQERLPSNTKAHVNVPLSVNPDTQESEAAFWFVILAVKEDGYITDWNGFCYPRFWSDDLNLSFHRIGDLFQACCDRGQYFLQHLDTMKTASDEFEVRLRIPVGNMSSVVALTVLPCRAQDGSKACFVILMSPIISSARLTQCRLKDVVSQQDVRNLLSVSRSIARQTQRYASDIDALKIDLQKRLLAVSIVYENALCSADGYVEIGELLNSIARITKRSEQVVIHRGPIARLSLSEAVRLATTVTEFFNGDEQSSHKPANGRTVEIIWNVRPDTKTRNLLNFTCRVQKASSLPQIENRQRYKTEFLKRTTSDVRISENELSYSLNIFLTSSTPQTVSSHQ
ncbi:HWE histidine kinase domain-containing protein (plasmid) [Kozakia baliensis]|uniref:HWE histidine kinase domain-containing protein n=1 Tax=Kozakia baliensis TaxID=153496 RepID=UPI00345B7CCE